jgi:hypothetical protein
MDTRMDTRYRDQGYAATFKEEPSGAVVTITKNGVAIGEIAVGFFYGDMHAKAQISIKRFRPNEFRDVSTVDDFYNA